MLATISAVAAMIGYVALAGADPRAIAAVTALGLIHVRVLMPEATQRAVALMTASFAAGQRPSVHSADIDGPGVNVPSGDRWNAPVSPGRAAPERG